MIIHLALSIIMINSNHFYACSSIYIKPCVSQSVPFCLFVPQGTKLLNTQTGRGHKHFIYIGGWGQAFFYAQRGKHFLCIRGANIFIYKFFLNKGGVQTFIQSNWGKHFMEIGGWQPYFCTGGGQTFLYTRWGGQTFYIFSGNKRIIQTL